MFIEFEQLSNARELGGLPAAEGRRVKSGVLLRTAKLSKLSEADTARLAGEFGVKHIFDFRDAVEFRRDPDREVPGAQLHSLPVLPGLPGESNEDFLRVTPERVTELMQGVYRTMAESDASAGAYRTFFRVLLASGGPAVLWHCTQGKDRTGVAALLLLTALGVPEEAAIEEYYLSNVPMGRRLEQLRDAGKSPEELAVMERLLLVTPECLEEYLSRVQAQFGGLEGYLRRRLGLTDADFAALRAWYTE